MATNNQVTLRSMILFMALGVVMAVCLVKALQIGLDREIVRQQAHTLAMCKDYGAAMNSWARQKNLTPPCKEQKL